MVNFAFGAVLASATIFSINGAYYILQVMNKDKHNPNELKYDSVFVLQFYTCIHYIYAKVFMTDRKPYLNVQLETSFYLQFHYKLLQSC